MDIARKQLNGLMTTLLGDLVNGAAVTIGSCWVETRSEGTPDNLYVPGAGGVENTIAFGQPWIGRFDMRLERTPALEAVVVGNGELSMMQPCIRLAARKLASRLLAPFRNQSRSGFAGRACGIRHLLSLYPATATLGQERRRCQLNAEEVG